VEKAQPFPLEIGIVARVIDGDTYDVKLERTGQPARVRLAWIDAPEPEQPFGPEATVWAKTSLLGWRVVLTVQDVDTYGRIVAQLSVEGGGYMWDAGATLARLGLGWLDPRYGAERESLHEDQHLARSEGIGLWS
jgi:endonuclease YncB( thermonuclease family)